MHRENWTDGRVQQLEALWSSGVSAASIAVKMGGVTRNAVIDKVHRLGLDPRKPSRDEASELRQLPRNRLRQAPPIDRTEKSWWRNAAVRPSDNDIPRTQRCDVFHLTSKTCRWPVGDPHAPDFFFCGAVPKDGSPYCATHHRRAHA